MHITRNLTSDTYDEETAKEVIKEIRNSYFGFLNDLFSTFEKEKNK